MKDVAAVSGNRMRVESLNVQKERAAWDWVACPPQQPQMWAPKQRKSSKVEVLKRRGSNVGKPNTDLSIRTEQHRICGELILRL